MTDKERLRYLLAHPDYWNDEEIKQEAEELGRKVWNQTPFTKGKKAAKIQVCLGNKTVLVGTAEEIAERSVLATVTIRNLARTEGTDRFGKNYRYLEM